MNNYLKIRDADHLQGLIDGHSMVFFIDGDFTPITISFNNNLFSISRRVNHNIEAVDKKGLMKQTEIGEAIRSGNLYMY